MRSSLRFSLRCVNIFFDNADSSAWPLSSQGTGTLGAFLFLHTTFHLTDHLDRFIHSVHADQNNQITQSAIRCLGACQRRGYAERGISALVPH